MRIQERWSKCGALWRQLDLEEQERFDNPAYLATLPNSLLPEKTSNTPQLAGPSGTSTTNENKKSKPCKLAKPKSFDISRWAKKIFHDLTNLSVAHSIQGYLVVVYLHKKGSAMLSGGSPLGKTFLDMFATDPDPCRVFLEFVKGQEALKKISGCKLPLPKRTRKRKANLRPGGPGKYNKVGKGWVEIAGCSADAPDAIGDVLMDEDEERPFVKNQGKSVHQTANEGHSDHADDSNNNTVNKTSKNSNSTTTSNKQPRNIQRQKNSKCASSEESEAEETPGESSKSKDTPTELSKSKDMPEESSHKGSEEDSKPPGRLQSFLIEIGDRTRSVPCLPRCYSYRQISTEHHILYCIHDTILHVYSGVSMAGAVKTNVKRPTQQSCLRCGSLASQLLCQACALIDGLSAQTQKHGSAPPKLHTNHESARNWYPVPLAAEFLVAKQAGLMISQGMSFPHNIRPL
ncbi:hypothetical protein PCASD_15067 [Puccinia coronata f. sp. avenae]|uniref:Uncharacterized protein n=1 Tax=Puccinia coronata f. sp. avenae TaxID=200324 RepID=A0A2N5UAY5_9BASI|nr:hypothetical protein PCASD_15067 [Puccinia coronata f. sp. avenae]